MRQCHSGSRDALDGPGRPGISAIQGDEQGWRQRVTDLCLHVIRGIPDIAASNTLLIR